MIKIIRVLSNKDKRHLISYGIDVKKSDMVSEAIIGNKRLLMINKRLSYIINDMYIPTLFNEEVNKLPSVYVDMGAIRFITNGADVMRPGIVKLNEFKANDIVVIRDEKHSKPLAIGKALYDSNVIEKMEKGKVIDVIHWVGDDIWEEGKSIGNG